MKVVLVSLARRGGMVHFVAELGNALASVCPTVAVISSSAKATYFSRKLGKIRVNTGRNALHGVAQSLNPFMWCHLLRRLAAQKADLVHIVGVHQWNPGVALLCKVLGKPLVYTVHDPDAHPGAPMAIRAADWMTAWLADELVALTRHGRTQLLSKGFSRNAISVIPHPMYTLFRRWRPRTAKTDRVILCFGRIEAYKGLEVLVRAYLSIRKALVGWTLIVAGSGRLPRSIAELVDEDIKFVNRYISDKEVAGLMHGAGIVALPYTSATQSGVLALAQAFGRPVVGSAVGGLKEMIVHGKTGILVPPDNGPALAEALESLAGDRRRLARMRRSIATQGRIACNPRDIARAHVSMYANVLGRQAGR
ncbi:MAG: glycosyltransferase family 4 protein [Chloroflexota bacterium]